MGYSSQRHRLLLILHLVLRAINFFKLCIVCEKKRAASFSSIPLSSSGRSYCLSFYNADVFFLNVISQFQTWYHLIPMHNLNVNHRQPLTRRSFARHQQAVPRLRLHWPTHLQCRHRHLSYGRLNVLIVVLFRLLVKMWTFQLSMLSTPEV